MKSRKTVTLNKKPSLEEQIRGVLDNFDFEMASHVNKAINDIENMDESEHETSIEALKKDGWDLLHIAATVCPGPCSRGSLEAQYDDGILSLKLVPLVVDDYIGYY